jgi:hypothetical protein
MSISMTSGGLFLNAPIIIAAALTLSTDLKKELDTYPSLPVVSMPQIKQYILKGAQNQNQEYMRMIKSDIEVYAGFYIIITMFIGANSLLAVFFFWQMMRMRYMMNPNLQGSFGKLDVLF